MITKNATIVTMLIMQSVICSIVFSQEPDTIAAAMVKEIDEIIVSATRRNELLSHTTYNTTVLVSEELELYPAQNLDDVTPLARAQINLAAFQTLQRKC